MERQKSDWKSLIRTFESSGLRAGQFCDSAGLNLGTFRSQLYKHRALNQQQSNFQEITVNTELSLSVNEQGQISLCGFEPDVLPSIIRAWSNVISN